MIKTIFLLNLVIGIISCTNSANKLNVQNNKSQAKSIITFNNVKGQAILIGEPIYLMDTDLKVINDISNQTTKLVKVTGVSDSLFNNTKDKCNAFWYVKIKIADKEGIVNGRQVFMIEDSDQDTTLLINGKKLEFLTTKCLAMGVVYQGDLMSCPVDQPVIIKDEKNNYFGLISVIHNNYYKEAIQNQDFRYFQLRFDAGYFDKIVTITPQKSGYKLSIHRGFQEGENDYDVLLKYEKGNYKAEYLNYGKIRYE